MEVAILTFVLFIRLIYSCPEKCYCDRYQTMTCDSVKLTADDMRELAVPSSVAEVRLVNNQLEEISSDILRNLRNLTSLEISKNNLKSIPSDCFEGFGYLLDLNLKHNSISVITRESFNGLDNLKRLDLDHNQVSELRAGIFDELVSVNSIKLSNNVIESIPNGVFPPLKHLRDLFVNNNKLSRIGNFSFQHMSMSKLGLSHNLLQRVPSSAFDKFKISFKILLFFNPLECFCRDVMDYAVNLKHLRNKVWGQCSTPFAVKGEDLLTASEVTECSMCHLTGCQNGGVCSGNKTSFECTCPEKFKGRLCEISLCKPMVRYVTKYVQKRGKSVIQFIRRDRVNETEPNIIQREQIGETEKKVMILYVMCSIEFIIIVCFVALFSWKRYQDRRLLREYDHQKRKQILEKIKNTTNKKLQESLY